MSSSRVYEVDTSQLLYVTKSIKLGCVDDGHQQQVKLHVAMHWVIEHLLHENSRRTSTACSHRRYLYTHWKPTQIVHDPPRSHRTFYIRHKCTMTASAINGHRESDQQRNSFKVDSGDIFQRGGGVRNYELSWAPWYHLELKPTQPRHGRLLSNMHATYTVTMYLQASRMPCVSLLMFCINFQVRWRVTAFYLYWKNNRLNGTGHFKTRFITLQEQVAIVRIN